MNELPPIKRARGALVYAERERFLDLDRLQGRALFGWRERRVMGAYRRVLATGLSMPYPSFWSRRLDRQLRRRFPGFQHVLIDQPVPPLAYPWRPASEAAFTLVLPDLGLAGYVYLFRSPAADSAPPPAEPSIAGVAALCAALGAWEHYERLPEDTWAGWEVPGWRRQGPWLWFEGTAAEYDTLRERLRCERILLPPTVETPACLPVEDLPAERRRWRRVLRLSPTD